jgi:hypothetical protein
VTVYHLLGDAFGFLVIVAHDRNSLSETAVGADEIGVISSQGLCDRLRIRPPQQTAGGRGQSEGGSGASDRPSARTHVVRLANLLEQPIEVGNTGLG